MPDLNDPRLLIAVSEPQELYLLRRYARQCGWNALHVGLGRYVLPAARREKPQLIILDAHLADLSGEMVLQALKSCTLAQHIPILCLAIELQKPPSLHQADAYMKKPVLYEDFAVALQHFRHRPSAVNWQSALFTILLA